MKTTLQIALAAAAFTFVACEAKVNTPAGTTEKTNTIVTPGGDGGSKTENNTTVVSPSTPAPSKTESNTSTTVTPSGTSQSTTTETK